MVAIIRGKNSSNPEQVSSKPLTVADRSVSDKHRKRGLSTMKSSFEKY